MSGLRGSRPTDGEWYAVPLGDGSFALCVATYFDGSHFAGFYFGPTTRSVDAFRGREDPNPLDAKLVAITEESGITSGRWLRVGRRTDESEQWELPEFIDRQGSTLEFLVRLEPRKYSWYVSRRRRPADDGDRRRDGFGFNSHQLVESELAERLRDDS